MKLDELNKDEREEIILVAFGNLHYKRYDEAKKYIKKYPDLKNIYYMDGNLLHHACYKKENLDFIKFLVDDLKMDVNSKNNKGDTPLEIAITYCDIDNIRFLLERGANPNCGIEDNLPTPLYSACLNDRLDIVQLLIDYGADVNATFYREIEGERIADNALTGLTDKKMRKLLESYGAKEAVYTPPEDMKNYNDVEDFIENEIGKISNTIKDKNSKKVSIDINIVEANEKNDYITLITSGISNKKMGKRAREQDAYCELMIKLPKKWVTDEESIKGSYEEWPYNVLRFIGNIPFGNKKKAKIIKPHPQDILINDMVILNRDFGLGIDFEGFMISLPQEKRLRYFGDKNGKMIRIFQIIPLFEEEVNLARDCESSQYMMKEFKKYNIECEVVNPDRENVCI